MTNTGFSSRATGIDGLVQVEMKQITDDRGTVREFFRESDFESAGIATVGRWCQINLTATRQGAVRGLHGEQITKFVSVASGRVFGAYLDAREGSPTFAKVVTAELEPGLGMLIAPGICNGFQALAPGTSEYLYCFDTEWSTDLSGVAVHVLDPDLAIPWPLPIDLRDRGLISEKDAHLPRLAEVTSGH